MYLNARFYSPELGCFLSEDTIEGNEEEIMTLNRYAYCKQDPVNYKDPSGHWGKEDHKKITETVLQNKNYKISKAMQECTLESVFWADEYFRYPIKNKNKKTKAKQKWIKYKVTLSETSKERLKLRNLKGYCDEGNITLGGKGKPSYKKNKFGSPYHGRGVYYMYLPYLLGLALQFQKGYNITNLALRNDNPIYQQMNFDMLIHLSGLYEDEFKTTISKTKYSYLILGIALHLAEDLWAHVAIINDTKENLNDWNKNRKWFQDFEELKKLRYTQGKPICYLNLSSFCKDGYYQKTHDSLAEETGHGVIERKRLMVSKCPRGTLRDEEIKLNNGKTVKCGRYVCSAADIGRDDACYLLYVNDKVQRVEKTAGKTVKIRLGFKKLKQGDAK